MSELQKMVAKSIQILQWWLGEMPGQMSFFDDELGGGFDV